MDGHGWMPDPEKRPVRGCLEEKSPLERPKGRGRHYMATPNRRKADLARIAVPPARALFPEPAAPCAVDPPPHFRYSLATQENSPRHVKPT